MENKKFFQIKNIIPIIIVIIVLGLFAVAFLGPIIKGIFFSTQKAFIYTTGQSTTGTVIGYETISNVQRNGNITYYYVPKVKFNTNYNEAIQTASKLNEIEAPMLTPGSVVNIKYSLSNPNNFIITDHNVMSNSNFLSLSSGLFIGSYIIMILLYRSSKNNFNNDLKKAKKHLKFNACLIVAITLYIVYLYVGINISVNSIMASVLFIPVDFLSIKMFRENIKTYKTLQNNKKDSE